MVCPLELSTDRPVDELHLLGACMFAHARHAALKFQIDGAPLIAQQPRGPYCFHCSTGYFTTPTGVSGSFQTGNASEADVDNSEAGPDIEGARCRCGDAFLLRARYYGRLDPEMISSLRSSRIYKLHGRIL